LWVKNSTIYLRKNDGKNRVAINCFEDFKLII
jgi:hypothetical protein